MSRHKLITLALAALLLVLPLSGCGEDQTPADVVREIFAAYNARDFEKAYDLSSSSLREKGGSREEELERMSVSWPQGTEIVDLEITDELIDGDKATVTWTGVIKTPELPDETGGATIELVKEDGSWRVGP